MDLKEAILKEHSKAQALLIRDYIGADQALFDELMTHFYSNEYRVTQRAAWIMSHCVDRYPFLINPHLEGLVTTLEQPKLHDAVKRNTVRIFQSIDLPEELLGRTVDICFKFLLDVKEPAAIRIFSMQVLYDICKKEPELADELRIVIEEFMPHGTAGFKSRGKKILKGLQKLLR